MQGDKMTVINIYYEDHKSHDVTLCIQYGRVDICFNTSCVEVYDNSGEEIYNICGKIKHKVMQSGLVVIDVYNAEYDF